MALLSQARDALRPLNSIEAVRSPEPAQAVPSPAAPAAPAGAKKQAPHTTEPDSISKRYYVEDQGATRHYYDDYQRKGLAMRATETVVSTKREDLNTIKAMFEVAENRGWKSVELKGTAEFKREAWIEAQTRGLEARGYGATDLDRQEADRRRGERGPNEVRVGAATPSPVAAKPASPAKEAMPAGATAAPKEATAAKVDPKSPVAVKDEEPSVANHRKALRTAQAELSPDGRLVLSALSETIDRQMNKQAIATRAEMKAFVATELVKKERAEGPVVLSPDQKRTAAAPEPVRARVVSEANNTRRLEPEVPSRSRSR